MVLIQEIHKSHLGNLPLPSLHLRLSHGVVGLGCLLGKTSLPSVRLLEPFKCCAPRGLEVQIGIYASVKPSQAILMHSNPLHTPAEDKTSAFNYKIAHKCE